MSGEFTQARKISGWASTVYLAPHPVVAQTQLYKELRDALKSVAHGSPRMFLALPLDNHELSFRTSLIELLQELKVEEKVLLPFERETSLPIILFNWQMDSEDSKEESKDLERSFQANVGMPLRISSWDCAYYVNKSLVTDRGRQEFVSKLERTSRLPTDSILSYALVAMSEYSDVILLKPSFFGIGVDLQGLFKRMAGRK